MADKTVPRAHEDHETRHRGDPVPVISRHKPDEHRENTRRQDALDMKLDYESEKSIAEAVEHKRTTRTQAGAHAGPVGSAHGPGYSGGGP